jgi:hypothetical protein
MTAPFTREEFLERAAEHERAAQVGLSVGPNIGYVRTFQACAAALRMAASVLTASRKSEPKESTLTSKATSARNIHLAIELLHRAQLEAALVLASAGEGILPKPDKLYLFKKQSDAVAKMSGGPGIALDINAVVNWIKHGSVDVKQEDGKVERVCADTVIVSDFEFEAINFIGRAISKFVAVYDERTQPMKDFGEWTIKRLPAQPPPERT